MLYLWFLKAFFNLFLQLVGYNVLGVSFQCTDKILERTAQVLTVVLTLKKKELKKGTRTRFEIHLSEKKNLEIIGKALYHLTKNCTKQ